MGILTTLKSVTEKFNLQKQLEKAGRTEKVLTGYPIINPAVSVPVIGGIAKGIAETAKMAIIKHPVKTAVGTIVGGGILMETKKPLKTLWEAPSKLFEFGKGVGTVIEEPSVSKAAKLIKEHPYITLAMGGIAAGAAIFKAAPFVSGYLAGGGFRDEKVTLPPSELPKESFPTETTPEVAATQPAGSETQDLKVGAKKRKRKKAITPTSISQKVNVNVLQNNSSKRIERFINQRCYV